MADHVTRPGYLGELIAAERKRHQLSQRELAGRILKEDGSSISPQYLNDIELGRRTPTSPHLLEQFSRELGVDLDHLYFLAGQIPADLREQPYSAAAFKAFRRGLKR